MLGERLHILILSDRDWTHPQAGGTGTNLHSQVSRWLAWGHRVSVISCSYRGAAACERCGSLTLHHVGGRSTVFPRVIWRQWRRMVPDADVVLEVVNGVTFLTPLWCRTPRVTLIHHIHRDHYAAELGAPGKVAAFALETLPLRLLYRGSRIETISQASARDIERHGVSRKRIEIVYVGADIDTLTPDPAVRASEPTLLYLGRLKRYKRIEIVLDVLQAVPDALLELAGDGDHREALIAEIDRRGLAGRVRVHGHVSEALKLELYRRAWVNVTASSAEGWGLSATEAGACGTPSAALRLGGLTEAIEDGRTGVLADDPAGLSAKVAALLANPELRDRLGRHARARAAEFSWDEAARRTLAVLDSERRRARPGARRAAGLLADEQRPLISNDRLLA
ncbi:MAG: glycosyltransferase family 4 protein [Solirubrobacteraceae bacterium]|jgi:glycosyltransferase involved in cell wall biosynthesis